MEVVWARGEAEAHCSNGKHTLEVHISLELTHCLRVCSLPKTNLGNQGVPTLLVPSVSPRILLHLLVFIFGLPHAAFGLIQNRFLVTPQLHREICGPRTAWLESGLIGSVPDII